ncbi:MAG: class F sortase [Dehalococcoidia bacterium]
MRHGSPRTARALTLVASLAALGMVAACTTPARTTPARTPSATPSATASPTSTPTPIPTPTATPSPTPSPEIVAARATDALPAPATSGAASAPAPAEAAPSAPPSPPPPAAVVLRNEFDASGMPLNTAGQPPRRPIANAASAGFPAPPPKAITAPPNAGGLARIVSAKFHLDHYIDVLGIVDGQMEAPDHDGSYAVGWYSTLGTPGGPGNAVLSAHETWNKMQGPFYFMHEAQPGDTLALVMADGRRLTYEVLRSGRYTVDSIPMAELICPPNRPAHEQWLTLITCGGQIVYHGAFGDYVDRDVVILRRDS